MTINLLKNLRLISVIGCFISFSLLLVNLVMIFFINNQSLKLHYSWITFFSTTFITLIASMLGYVLDERYRLKRRAIKGTRL